MRARRLGLLGAVALLVLAVGLTAIAEHHPAAAPLATKLMTSSRETRWVTSWTASPQAGPSRGFDNRTIRNIVFSSTGGDAVRLELANLFDAWPLQVGDVTVAVAGPGAEVVPGTVHRVRFGGLASFQVPADARLLSDPVLMRVGALQ